MKKVFLVIISGFMLCSLTGCSSFKEITHNEVVEIYMKNAAKDRPSYSRVNIKILTEKFNITAKNKNDQDKIDASLNDFVSSVDSAIAGIPGADFIQLEEGKSNTITLTLNEQNPLLAYECHVIPDVTADVIYYAKGDYFKFSQSYTASTSSYKMTLKKEITYNDLNLLSSIYVYEEIEINDTSITQDNQNINEYDYTFTIAINTSLSYSK